MFDKQEEVLIVGCSGGSMSHGSTFFFSHLWECCRYQIRLTCRNIFGIVCIQIVILWYVM